MLLGQVAERVDADQRLDPADAGADRRLGEDLHQAELAGPGDVRAAAQLAGVVADLDDPHLVAVLLAEQRHRAQPARLVLRGDERVHLEVAQQHLVDLLLDVEQHRRRHRAGRVEVEPQPAGRVERTRLGRRLAEEVAHRLVHQVGGGVRAGDRPPPAHVDLGEAGLARRAPRRGRPAPCARSGRERAAARRTPRAAPRADRDQAVVGLLAAALGVERGRVEDQLDGVALARRVERDAVGGQQRPYPRLPAAPRRSR